MADRKPPKRDLNWGRLSKTLSFWILVVLIPIAFIQFSSGPHPTKEDLDEFVRATLAPHKAPRRWFFLDEFPVNALGKVQKFALRAAARSPR